MKPRKYKLGLNKEEVLDRIGRDKWLEFSKWMGGQTGAIADDGTLLYYDVDVERFMENKNSFRD